ncbi:MAG: CobW family GTP-binding protein [Geminicoccaceae bacterium]
MITLTGFLGAGKTTLLRKLLQSRDFGEAAVLVNEFGEIGLDNLMFETISPDVLLLDSGCVCCQIRGELKQAIVDLLDRRSSGDLPPFQKIVIETTGLAEPAPLLSTFTNDPLLASKIVPGPVLVVVDALTGSQVQNQRTEWYAQLCSADVIAVSKLDMADIALVDLANELKSLNPMAYVAHVGDIGTIIHSLQKDRQAPRDWALARNVDQGGRHGQVETFSLVFDKAVDWTPFGVWLSAILHYHGSKILRVKGHLNTNGPGPVVLNGVQHVLHMPEHMSYWPTRDRRSKIVFIVSGMEPDALRRSALQILELASEADIETTALHVPS